MLAFRCLEELLDRSGGVREEPVAELLQVDLRFAPAVQQLPAASLRLRGPVLVTRQNHPDDSINRQLVKQAEDGSAATDLEIVAVRSEAEQLEPGAGRRQVSACDLVGVRRPGSRPPRGRNQTHTCR